MPGCEHASCNEWDALWMDNLVCSKGSTSEIIRVVWVPATCSSDNDPARAVRTMCAKSAGRMQSNAFAPTQIGSQFNTSLLAFAFRIDLSNCTSHRLHRAQRPFPITDSLITPSAVASAAFCESSRLATMRVGE